MTSWEKIRQWVTSEHGVDQDRTVTATHPWHWNITLSWHECADSPRRWKSIKAEVSGIGETFDKAADECWEQMTHD